MMRNLITDVPGILIGNAHDTHVKTGTTVLTGDLNGSTQHMH